MNLTFLNRNPKLIRAIIVIFYSVGIAGLSLEFSREIFRLLVPFTLLGSVILMLLMDESNSGKLWYILAVIYIASFFIEMAGVNTGIVFGTYEYGRTLGFKVVGTPLMIGINWIILVYAIWQWVGKARMNGLVKILLASTAMVVYDFVLEPIAMILDMWDWEGGQIPVQNYIAWFVISFIFFSIFQVMGIKVRNKISTVLLLTQFGFFIVLNFTLI
jgi:putative membrane protein